MRTAVILLAMPLLLAVQTVNAGVPLEQALELCRAEQNALKRLLCYDAIHTGDISTATPAPAITPAKQATEQAQTAESGNQFGLEHRQQLSEAEDKIYATVSSISQSARKELIIDFDNGQRWRQIDSGTYLIKAGEQHYIKRGVLNSFFLGNDKNNRTIRVRREH